MTFLFLSQYSNILVFLLNNFIMRQKHDQRRLDLLDAREEQCSESHSEETLNTRFFSLQRLFALIFLLFLILYFRPYLNKDTEK